MFFEEAEPNHGLPGRRASAGVRSERQVGSGLWVALVVSYGNLGFLQYSC